MATMTIDYSAVTIVNGGIVLNEVQVPSSPIVMPSDLTGNPSLQLDLRAYGNAHGSIKMDTNLTSVVARNMGQGSVAYSAKVTDSEDIVERKVANRLLLERVSPILSASFNYVFTFHGNAGDGTFSLLIRQLAGGFEQYEVIGTGAGAPATLTIPVTIAA